MRPFLDSLPKTSLRFCRFKAQVLLLSVICPFIRILIYIHMHINSRLDPTGRRVDRDYIISFFTVQTHLFCLFLIHRSSYTCTPVAFILDVIFLEYVINLVFVRKSRSTPSSSVIILCALNIILSFSFHSHI